MRAYMSEAPAVGRLAGMMFGSDFSASLAVAEAERITAETHAGDCTGAAGDFAIPAMHARILAEALAGFVVEGN